jgi:thymidine kinase
MAYGEIDFISGLMNSGKTSEMIMQAHGVEEGGVAKALIIVPDTLGVAESGKHTPRAKLFNTNIDIVLQSAEVPSDRISAIIPKLGGRCLKAVFVDEAQFLSKEQVYDLASFAHKHRDIDVKAFGLRTDYKLELFPGTEALYAVANVIKIEKAKCYLCGSANPFINTRRINGEYNFDPSSDQVAVNNQGGITYETDCLDCIEPIVNEMYERGEKIADSVLRVVGIK